MSTIERVLDDRGRVRAYRARWRDPSGRQRKRTFPRKLDAERHLAAVVADAARGTWVEDSRVTVADYARQYAALRPHRPSTARVVGQYVEIHLAATPLGARRLNTVRPSDVQAWAISRSAVLSPITTRNVVGFVRGVFAAAVLDRLIGVSPVQRIALPRHEPERVVPLTVDQVQRLVDEMPQRSRAMVITQAGLGLRIGELLALRLEHVDFLRRTVRVEEQLLGATRHRGDVKTPRSRRVVPLPQVVADELAAHLQRFGPGTDGSLFTTSFGLPWRSDYYGSHVLRPAVTRAGLPSTTTSHDLRHHYASVLLAAGESVPAVAERLGHVNGALVLSTYGHLLPDREDRTRKAVDDAWCARSVPAEDLAPALSSTDGPQW